MSKAFDVACRLLTMREYGAYELTQKLLQKGYSLTESEQVLVQCQHLGLQSDARFVASLYRVRVRQGYGPQRIMHDLSRAHIDKDMIRDVFLQESSDWMACAMAVLEKKYRNQRCSSYEAIQKQKQFLRYRGFTSDIIQQVFKQPQPLISE